MTQTTEATYPEIMIGLVTTARAEALKSKRTDGVHFTVWPDRKGDICQRARARGGSHFYRPVFFVKIGGYKNRDAKASKKKW